MYTQLLLTNTPSWDGAMTLKGSTVGASGQEGIPEIAVSFPNPLGDPEQISFLLFPGQFSIPRNGLFQPDWDVMIK